MGSLKILPMCVFQIVEKDARNVWMKLLIIARLVLMGIYMILLIIHAQLVLINANHVLLLRIIVLNVLKEGTEKQLLVTVDVLMDIMKIRV